MTCLHVGCNLHRIIYLRCGPTTCDSKKAFSSTFLAVTPEPKPMVIADVEKGYYRRRSWLKNRL
jgi:hypothetical protein